MSSSKFAYLLGGSHDLTKMPLKSCLEERGLIELCKREPLTRVLSYAHGDRPMPEEVVGTVERYTYKATLKNGDIVFEYNEYPYG